MASRDGDSDSVIDLALITLNIASMIRWSVMDDHGSDHLPCTIHVKRRRSKRPPKRPKAFTYLNKDENLVSKLRQKAQTRTCQQKTVISQPPWWDPDMEELWKSKRKALRLAQRDNTNGNLKEAAKTASHEFKVAATKAKSDKYERFCVEVTEDRALIKFWNLYGAMTNKRKPGGLPDFKNEDGVLVFLQALPKTICLESILYAHQVMSILYHQQDAWIQIQVNKHYLQASQVR